MAADLSAPATIFRDAQVAESGYCDRVEVEDREVETQVRRLTKETVVAGKRVEVGKLASRSIFPTMLESRVCMRRRSIDTEGHQRRATILLLCRSNKR